MADYDENGGSFHEKLRKWLPPPKSQFDVPWPCENQFEVSSTIFVAACLYVDSRLTILGAMFVAHLQHGPLQ